ncbi:MAG TPA: metalloregulator ArsR/SmtB family transcription factor [Longimicrobiaceae bacterium]|nr:metalloregulator ArsR/SmtB family transcription factor [Longimicrobiaceae bacterium]
MRGKTELYAQFARIGRALGSVARLEILDLLTQSERTVEELAEEAGLGVKNASAHLRVLREARLVEARKNPPYVVYRLADEGVGQLVRSMQAMAAERLAEVQRVAGLYLESPLEMEPVGVEELRRRVEGGEVTLLDVRPAQEYRWGHIPGAVSVPIDELEDRLAEVPADRPVIAYCRGPYCVYAVRAVEKLRAGGWSAERAEAGVEEWRSAGHPVWVGEA